MSNQRIQKRHSKALLPSSIDNIQLGMAIETRFLELLGSWKRIHGEELEVPQMLDSAMILWRQLMVRHKKRDFRNSLDEVTAMHEIAQWTVDKNCVLRNQPLKKVQWAD